MHSFDLNLQDSRALGSRHSLVWGAGYRWTSDATGAAHPVFLHPDHLVNLSSAFLQDEIALLPRLKLTVGGKVLWNTYSHFEYQPSLRLFWKPAPTQAFWAAVSRAVRTPSDIERDDRFALANGSEQGLPIIVLLTGNPRFGSEVVHAFEAGYRRQFHRNLSLDFAGFVNHYSSLGGTSVGAPSVVFTPTPAVLVPATYVNAVSSASQGVEASLLWSPVSTFHFQSSYAWMQNRFDNHGGPNVLTIYNQDWATPRNTFDLRGFWTPLPQWTVGAILNGNSAISSSASLVSNSPSAVAVPAHTRLDLRLTRALTENLNLSAGTTNLLQARHPEFFSVDYVVASQIPRSAWIRLQWTH